MANLIITIISIAIVGIAAAMGVYYGGVAYENAQINALANAIMNDANQLLGAARVWSSVNGYQDISGMGTAGAAGTGIAALVSGGQISQWPTLPDGLEGTTGSPWKPGPPSTLGPGDSGCYAINGYSASMSRGLFAYNSGIYVVYVFGSSTGVPCWGGNKTATTFTSSSSDITQVNHPIVRIAKAINTATGQTDPGADMSAMPYIGLPQAQQFFAQWPWMNSAPGTLYDDTGGLASSTIRYDAVKNVVPSNFCYLVNYSSTTQIICVFGPS